MMIYMYIFLQIDMHADIEDCIALTIRKCDTDTTVQKIELSTNFICKEINTFTRN